MKFKEVTSSRPTKLSRIRYRKIRFKNIKNWTREFFAQNGFLGNILLRTHAP